MLARPTSFFGSLYALYPNSHHFIFIPMAHLKKKKLTTVELLCFGHQYSISELNCFSFYQLSLPLDWTSV